MLTIVGYIGFIWVIDFVDKEISKTAYMIFTSFSFYSVNVLTLVAVYCFEMAIISLSKIDPVISFKMKQAYSHPCEFGKKSIQTNADIISESELDDSFENS